MPFLRFLIQLVLCVVVLVAGVAGFKYLKDGSPGGSAGDSASAPAATSPAAADEQTGSAPTGSSENEPAGADGTTTASVAETQAQKNSSAAERQAPADLVPVSVIRARKTSHSPILRVYGTVETPRETALTSGVNADVTQVTVLEGQDVEKGQLLVELDSTDLNLTIAQRKAELRELGATADAERRRQQANVASLESEREILVLSKRQLDRFTKLAARQIGTRSAADDAARTVRQQELAITTRQNAIDDFATTMAGIEARESRVRAQIKQAERDLARTRIVAPFAGRVTNVAVSPGNRVRSGEAIATVYDTALVEIRAQIPNRLVPEVQKALDSGSTITGAGELEGQRIDVRLDRYAARTRAGSGSVDALLRVTGNASPQLGRTVEVRLDLPTVASSLALPAEAVNDAGKVFVVRDGALLETSIDVLGETINDAGQTQILVSSSEIDEDDAIVVSQVPSGRDGLAVKILKDN